MPAAKRLTPDLAVTSQLHPQDMAAIAKAGFNSVINTRPDREVDGQPTSAELEAASKQTGLTYFTLPVSPNNISDAEALRFAALRQRARGPVLSFCDTGNRCVALWALSESHRLDPRTIEDTAAQAGHPLGGLHQRLQSRWERGPGKADSDAERSPARTWDVLIVGAGAGAFRLADSARAMSTVIPRGAKWIRAQVAGFDPDHHRIVLEDGDRLSYRSLVVAPGLTLDLDAVDGLREGLGHNGVTSNYLFDYAAYTWQCVQNLKRGRALFTQPPMPIKCAGAPQKALYLSCHYWEHQGVLGGIDVNFHNAGDALFGVADFVPPLMEYVERYNAHLQFNSNLKAVDAAARKAWFTDTDADGKHSEREEAFDLLHVTPPQKAPTFVADSPLANGAGWVDADAASLQHPRYPNVFTLGDASGTANAKTAAAVRKQAPVLAENLLAMLDDRPLRAHYDGYGACPLTVEKGKVLLAEFGYNGALQPTFPLDPTRARKLYWLLKTRAMPWIYFDLMLKGHEWLTGTRA